MNIAKLIHIDFRRQWFAHLALALAAAIVGASIAGALFVQVRLAAQLRPPAWGATIALIPKGVTLESLNEDLKTGHARALLPKVLFESLKGQVIDEQSRRGFAAPSLEFFAVLPSHGPHGEAELLTLGTLPVNEEPWRGVTSEPWKASSAIATPEWGEQVVEAIFARGSLDAAMSLKTLADRRTVAQAILISEEVEAQKIKAKRTIDQIWIAVLLVAICGALTLLLSLRLTSQQRKNLFDVLEILGAPGERVRLFAACQLFLYLLIPALAGVGVAVLCFI